MEENFYELSAVKILLKAGITQGSDPCQILEELIAQIDDTLDKNPQDAGTHARKQEAQMLKAQICNG